MLFSTQMGKRSPHAVSTSFTGIFIFLCTFCTIFLGNYLYAQSPGVNTELRMNEGTGTITADISGNTHNGTLTNGPTWTAGKYGQAINLDGVNDYVNIADHADFTLNPGQGYTWSAWIKGTSLAEWGTIWSQTVDANNFFYFYAHSTSDPDGGPVTNGVSVYWWNGTNRLSLHSNNNVLTAGQWAYIAITYNGSAAQASRFTIYINGTDVTNRSDVVSSGALASLNPANIRLGSNQPYGDYFNGAIDEVRYYLRALTATEIQTDMNTGNAPDTQAPTVSLTAPAAGNVSGTVNVTASASDNIGVAGVQFLLDGVNLGSEDLSTPYSFSWNTGAVANGNHTLTAKARDAAGNTTTSAAVIVSVNNDTQAPTVSITAPVTGNVSGTINITADAADNIGVAGVQFLLDGANLGTEDLTSPYSISWNTTGVVDGSHTLTAKARDATGNTTTSVVVAVNVTNNPPDTQAPAVSITTPAAGNVAGAISITASASDNVGVAGVQFLLDGVNLGTEDLTSPYSISWNTSTVTNGSHTLTAKARDAAGNNSTSTAVIVMVNNDTQAPTVSITTPAAGTVTGTISITANASDNVGVAGVQFLLDGANLAAEDVSSPYSVSWNTTTATNGTHNLTARARDAAGNITTSSTVTVTVSNAAGTLVVAMPLDEGAGTAAADISGSSHPGTLTNGPAWTAGKYGQGVNLDGTNDYIAIADHADFTLDPTQKYTWSAWVKNNSFKEWSTVWSQTVNNASFFYFYAHTTTDPDGGPVTNGISVYWWNNSGSNKLGVHSNNNVLTLGQWSYVTVTYDGALTQANRFSIYVNGVDVTNRSDISSSGTLVSINPANTRIGSNQPFGEYLNGAVDEVRFYKRLLTAAEIQTDMNTPMGLDNTGPSVSITAPAAGIVSGTINVTATATDNAGVAGVQFLLDGVNLGSKDLVSPYSISWNTSTVSNGSHVLTARARDAAGNTATSAAINVTVSNDVQAPVVSITAPAAGDVAGTVNVMADATDNVGVAGVQFLLDGVNLGSEDLVSPYLVSWNTTTIGNGNHTLVAKARDVAGNTTTSAAVIVNVNNDVQPPVVSITAPAAGIVNGITNITVNATDNAGVAGVQFLLDGVALGTEVTVAPYTISWNTVAVADGNHTLTAKARDAAGNTTTSAAVVVTVQNNPPDTEPPSPSITSPGPGIVNGTITITANATDNVGVVGVQFLLDGANLGGEDVSAPYSVSWNTTVIADGSHTLTAKARDAAGNIATSAPTVVNVLNNPPDTQFPTVSITAPPAGQVSGTINVTANASDNIGVAGVQFQLDGTNLGTEDLSSPYSVSWNTLTASNGNHTLTAKARDAAGNITTSASVVVNVNNVVTNLMAALPFDEGAGTNATDVSGKNHPGILTNGPTWTAGKYVQAVNLDGTNDYVNIADHADFTLDPAQSYTWSGWVRGTNLAEWGTVWSQTLDANNFFYFYAHSTSDPDGGPVTNGISLYWWNGSNRVSLHSNNNVLTAGQWAFVAITYNGTLAQASRFTIYVNGADVTNRTDVVSAGTLASLNPTNIRIGSNQPYGDYFNGAIDEVRYYQRALSAADIQTDMNTPLGVDNSAPAASITSPAPGNVSGTINVTANASDNVGVVGVQFLLDGANLGSEDLAAPYAVSWNTGTASAGTHTLAARARDAAGNITTSATVNVTINPDFSFTLLTPSKSAEVTGSADYDVSVAYQNGFTSNNVALSVSGLPAGVTGNYLINPLSDQGQTQLHLVTANATAGTYTFTLSATANSITHTQTGTLIINGPADFALSASPSVQNVTAGNGVSYTITLSETGDFVNPVILSVQGLPATITASFNPASPVPVASSILTISTSASTIAGTYNLTVQGAGGSLIHSIPISLTVSSTPPPTWPVTNLGSGWDMPIGVCFSKDGQQMFVWEKGGKVFVCNRNATTQLYDKQATPVIDISAEVGNWGDHGLNGFALDPNFASNGLIYLLYVVDRNYLLNFGTPNYNPSITDAQIAEQATIGRVTRYKTNISAGIVTADLATRTILIGETKSTGIPVLHDSHGMGSLVFASDGTLLVSAGDGATYNSTDIGNNGQTYYFQALNDGIINDKENVGAMRSQYLNSHDGKILRIDPATGNGLPSNPFYSAAAPRAPKSRVWALGFRNPFRFNIRPGTGSTNPDAGDIGEIYVGDVGWRTYEELNIIKVAGTNCGWPIFEGVNYETPGQPGESSYASLAPPNTDEPNPLFGSGGCNQQYFTFNNLIRQATADGSTTVFNPCNSSVPITGSSPNRYVHRRPVIDWKHFVDSARVPTFNGNIASFAQIGTGASGVSGTPFPGNCSIGGFWYTGNLFPANFRNTYFHADYGAQWIKCFSIGFADVVQQVQDFYSGMTAITCMAENPLDGTMVYVDIGTNQVVRIGYGGNQLPVAKAGSDVTFGASPLTVNFNSMNSFDPDGGALAYQWNFGDATTSTQANPSHSFTSSGGVPKKFVVTLTVKDNMNATAIDSIIVSVNNTPPQVHIISPVNNSLYRPTGTDTVYALTANVTDAEHSPGQLRYEWQKILRHNNHEHQSPVDTTRNSTVSISRIGCNGEEYYWLIRLKVTDAAGLSGYDSSKIYPDCNALVLRDFYITQQTGENIVQWVTESEQPVTGYELQASQDGYHFYTIHHQQPRRGSGQHVYGYVDNSFVKGTNYYRVKMLGESIARYSSVVKVVSAEKGGELMIYPNPSKGSFFIRYKAPGTGLAVIRISDINGRTVSLINKNVMKGQNNIYIENKPGWKPGMFVVTVQQGNDLQQGKLVYQGLKAQ